MISFVLYYLQIRLRVVREFNLPDAVADLLENAACYYPQETQEDSEMPLRGHSQVYF